MVKPAPPRRHGDTARAAKPRTRVRELLDQSDPALKQAYALMRQSFARTERIRLSEWRASLREKASDVWTDQSWHLVIAEQDGRVVGLTSGSYLGNVNLGIVGYLAIEPAARSRGIGTRLRARLRTLFERDALRIAKRPLEGIVGEVSESNPWLRSLARRKNVLVLDFPYCQPRLYDTDQPSQFLLYYESLQRQRDRLPVGELRGILYTIWRRIYRVSRPLDRAAFRAMLRHLETRRSIGRRKLKRADDDR
jgi:GNAT superfamily N-acetyltransferase